MTPQFLSSALSKAQIVQCLGLPVKTKETKAQLVTRLHQLIEHDALARERLLNTFPQELAVEPVELESLLHCTKAERRRWIAEGRIPVLEYRTFRKAGRELSYPVCDRRVILNLSQDEIASWREAHQEQVRLHRSAGAHLAAQKKESYRQIREEARFSWKRMVQEWQQQGSQELAAILHLAYWTVWASRWAKENHRKALKSIKYCDTYIARREDWYERKNQALRLLSRTPYAKIAFYRPSDPDKYYLDLCEKHYEMKREGYYETIWEFYEMNKEIVEQCPLCLFQEEKDFYALYYLEITTEVFPELRFAFHTPYPLGKSWFPSPTHLPHVHHIEQDGLFRFGRALLENEKITHREQDVLTHFEQVLAGARNFYSANDE